MQEISPGVYIDNGYAGVTVGAINWVHGLILIDAPFRVDDIRSWRSALLTLGGGMDRLLINLDAHLDRTLGVRSLNCTVIGHERMVEVFQARPLTIKIQPGQTGEEWELWNSLGSIRWMPPEITFSHQLTIHSDNNPVLIEHHPGPAPSAAWVALPEKRILFVGDAVIPNQPPFLANAELSLWIEQLNLLLSPAYKHWLIISGRGGLVTTEDIRRQLRYLEKVEKLLANLASRNTLPADIVKHIPSLLSGFDIPEERANLYQQRLRHGLSSLYSRGYNPGTSNTPDVRES
ncbi:MAG: MBL fold metallo-hydrolase [Anaerolineaceae bacterium]|nr:MBL fold metallo-hydrolase [Anaerolineaceae bacterium]